MNTNASATPARRNDRLANAFALFATVVLVASLGSGCSILRAGPDNSRFFVLSSTGASNAAAPGRTRADVYFGLGPVKLPGYLDTQSFVLSNRDGSVEYMPDTYWAESLGSGFTRALLYRTGARIGTSHAVAYPWYATTRVDWKVPVDVLRFEATEDGRAVLVARWSVARNSDDAVVAGSELVCEETAGGDPALIVDALSRCVDRLAEAVAAAISVQAPAPAASRPR
jgi:uncharacterized protein